MATDRLPTPRGRLSFPFLFKPRPAQKKGDKEFYELSLIFDEEAQKTPEWKAISEAVKTLALSKFGVDAAVDASGKIVAKGTPGSTVKRVVPPAIKNPIKKGDGKVNNKTGEPIKGYEPGTVYISAKTERQPGMVDGALQKIANERDLYAGCYCRATISVYAYDRPDSKGIAFGLRNVQKVADGDPLGSGGDPTKDFGVVEGYAASAASTDFSAASGPTTGGDEVPF